MDMIMFHLVLQMILLLRYNPASEIKVTNTHTFPVKIVMWTEGEGTSMRIYAKMVRFVPTGEINSNNLTTNSTVSQDIGNSST